MIRTEADDAYVVVNDHRIGVYPGKTVSTHESHWAACEAMFLYNTTPREPDVAA